MRSRQLSSAQGTGRPTGTGRKSPGEWGGSGAALPLVPPHPRFPLAAAARLTLYRTGAERPPGRVGGGQEEEEEEEESAAA